MSEQLLPTITLNNNQIHIQSHDKNTCFIVAVLPERKIEFSGKLPQNTELLYYFGGLCCNSINPINVEMRSNILTMVSRYNRDTCYKNIIDFNEMTHRVDIACNSTNFLRKRSPSYAITISSEYCQNNNDGVNPTGIGYDADKDKIIITVYGEDGSTTKCIHFKGSEKLFKITLGKNQKKYQFLKECVFREGDLDGLICRKSILGKLFIYKYTGREHVLFPPQIYIEHLPWIRCCDENDRAKVFKLFDIDACEIFADDSL